MKLPSNVRIRPISTMSNTASSASTVRIAAALVALLAISLRMHAQNPGMLSPQSPQQQRVSQLPPTPPTSLQQQATPQAPGSCQQPPCTATGDDGPPKPTRPHHAMVTFADGKLTVMANDSSLHQILRSISSRTGMTITGGVEEQRVFGTYGPSDPATILATLLDGTGVNMLLKDGPGHTPVQLVLTQRSGGPSISPITAQDEQIGTEEPSAANAPTPAVPSPAPVFTTTQPTTQPLPTTSGPSSIPQPANNVLGNPNNVTPTASQIPTVNSVPIDSVPTPSTTVQTQQGIVDTPNQGTSSQPQQGAQAPTPDSVFQQLLQMQKAKTAAAGPTPPPTTTPPQ